MSSDVARKAVRLRSELAQINKHPSPGIRVYFEEADNFDSPLKVEMTGPDKSPFHGQTLTLTVTIPDRYPFDPPLIQFTTPVYHPNIDPTGRICLHALKPKPTGSWSVTLNIITVLASIRVLLVEPNLEDPLMPEIAHEFTTDHNSYFLKASSSPHHG